MPILRPQTRPTSPILERLTIRQGLKFSTPQFPNQNHSYIGATQPFSFAISNTTLPNGNVILQSNEIRFCGSMSSSRSLPVRIVSANSPWGRSAFVLIDCCGSRYLSLPRRLGALS